MKQHHPFYNLITALVTPFSDGSIDFSAFEKLLSHQRNNNVSTVVVAGSTGEALSLEFNEYRDLLTAAKKSQLSVIAGCCSSSTKYSIEMAKVAEKLGADGVMCNVPSYNKPSQDGLYLHFKAIHDAINIPIMIYSNIGRSCSDVNDDTIIKLSKLERIVAIKDSSGDIERPMRLAAQIPTFTILAGDDTNILPFYAQGASGLVSVASNVIPSQMLKICQLATDGNFKEARDTIIPLLSLLKTMFIEVNPVAVKYALSLMGICNQDVRLPLTLLQKSNKEVVENILHQYKII